MQFNNPGYKWLFLILADIALFRDGLFSGREWDENIEIYFANGRMRIEMPPALLRNVPAKVELYKAADIQETRLPHSEWSWAFRRQAEAFIRDVREGRESFQAARILWKISPC